MACRRRCGSCGTASREGRHIEGGPLERSPRNTTRGRPWSWITGRPRLIDTLVVVFNFAAGALSLLGTSYRNSATAAILGLVLIEAAALFWRRSHPNLVLLVVVGAALVAFAISPDRDVANPALAFAVYAVSVYDGGRARLWVLATALTLVAAAVALLLLNDFEMMRKILPAGVTTVIAWTVGDYIRSRRRFLSELVARHQQDREQAAEEERLRIARELHDVVAHNVSAMAIQAGAARMTGTSSQEALESIEEGARATLAELNRLLGVLRKSPGAPLAPQPRLVDADALLKPVRAAGLEATLKVTGDQRSLPQAIELSAYRIIQEAITNVLRHANASRVEVTVRYESDALELTFSDNGTGTGENESTGHGLIGMQERVDLFGGEMTTGSSPLGGFTVHARLPLKP